MSDYTLIASKQSTRKLHTLFGSQWYGVFWQCFGSKLSYIWQWAPKTSWQLWSSPCSGTSILHVSTVVFFANFSPNPTSTSNLTVSSESQWNIDSNGVLSVQKYYQLLTHESNTFLGQTMPKFTLSLKARRPHSVHQCLRPIPLTTPNDSLIGSRTQHMPHWLQWDAPNSPSKLSLPLRR